MTVKNLATLLTEAGVIRDETQEDQNTPLRVGGWMYDLLQSLQTIITSGTPSSVGTVNAEGSSDNFSRADHVHAHANQAGGALHALATTSVAGFMSPADKQAIATLSVDPGNHASRHLPAGGDPISTAAPVTIGTSNQAGSANFLARSDHVHDHGQQTASTLHAVATTGANGFMSASDKVIVNSVGGHLENAVYWSNGSVNVWSQTPTVSKIFLGAAPSASGTIGLSFSSDIYMRASNGLSDVPIINVNSSGLFTLGPTSQLFDENERTDLRGIAEIRLVTGGTARIIVGESVMRPYGQDYENGAPSFPYGKGYYKKLFVGASNVATSGAINLAYGSDIYMRNQGNNDDYPVISVSDATGNLSIGASLPYRSGAQYAYLYAPTYFGVVINNDTRYRFDVEGLELKSFGTSYPTHGLTTSSVKLYNNVGAASVVCPDGSIHEIGADAYGAPGGDTRHIHLRRDYRLATAVTGTHVIANMLLDNLWNHVAAETGGTWYGGSIKARCIGVRAGSGAAHDEMIVVFTKSIGSTVAAVVDDSSTGDGDHYVEAPFGNAQFAPFLSVDTTSLTNLIFSVTHTGANAATHWLLHLDILLLVDV